jgi:hypothetical protein
MSDARRRLLEREAAHDPDAAERVLVARWRAGELDPLRVNLAAELGHDGAARLIGLDRAPRQVIVMPLATIAGHMRYEPERRDHDPRWKEAGITAACAMAEVARQAHHEDLRRGRRHTDYDREEPPVSARRVMGCSDPKCDLSIRVVSAAREWVTDQAMRAPNMSLCWALAGMANRRLIEIAQSGEEAPDVWVAGPAAMVTSPHGRPDLLPRIYESAVRGLPHAARQDLVESCREAVARTVTAWCLS